MEKEMPDRESDLLMAVAELADREYGALKDKVGALMKEHGEDPANPYLIALRVQQTACCLNSSAEREANRMIAKQTGATGR
jgi:hypothetical protein